MSEPDDPRYPIGRWRPRPDATPEDLQSWIEQIESLPAELAAAIEGFTPEQLDSPYRPGSWTVRQLVHHVADSHINAYVRFKLALTEDEPTIRPYDEGLWAKLPDTWSTPVETSLELLRALHRRWVDLLRALPSESFERTLVHPDIGRLVLKGLLGMYAWHGRHHTAHVVALRQRMGW
ncbi:MAG TPA: bacillithiol transferase BstA [Thermoanaerobaculia bacterium]|nr:bacillithiol transferase BstA [Thermoanaerobaculia bacterium]